MKTFRIALAVGLLAAGISAQAIDATEYFPLGSFAAWEMVDRAAWDNDGLKAEPQIISVTKTTVVEGVPRYNVRTKLFQDVPDVLFQFGLAQTTEEGFLNTLYLYGVRVLLPKEFIDNDDVKVSIPTIFFDQPILVGTESTLLNNPVVTPVTATFPVKLKIGDFGSVSGKVFIDPGSSVTVTWIPETNPIDTPLGTLPFAEGGPPLARLKLDFFLDYSSNNDDINDEIEDLITEKSVSGVMGPGLGYVLIDGQGSQQKILNRALLPGQLVYNPADLDAFPPLPSYDVDTLEVPLSDGVVLIGAGGIVEGASITDGTVSIADIELEHNLAGVVTMTGNVTAGGFGPVAVNFKGKTKFSTKTGGLKFALKGKTKQIPEFAKTINFSVKTEIPLTAEGTASVDLVYKAGKDPITKEPIGGTLSLPLTLFKAAQASMDLGLPVDVPKIKKALLFISDAKRKLGAEGFLTLTEAGDEGASLVYPITLRESAKVKEGFPTKRTYSVNETGNKKKLFKFAGTTDAGFDLLKFSGKLTKTKVKPEVTDVVVQTQNEPEP